MQHMFENTEHIIFCQYEISHFNIMMQNIY